VFWQALLFQNHHGAGGRAKAEPASERILQDLPGILKIGMVRLDNKLVEFGSAKKNPRNLGLAILNLPGFSSHPPISASEAESQQAGHENLL